MALSNWDTLALDKDGKSINGALKSPLGVVVSIYKNWIYVTDPVAWQKGGAYVEHTVMEIQEGNLTYKDVKIVAKRGPQNGIYCVVHTLSYKDPAQVQVMVGIGCYGYDGENWTGVEPASVEYLQKLCTNDGELFEACDWFEVEEILNNMDFSKAIRFNQGDEYFAAHIGTDIPATEVGKAEEPVIMKVIEKAFK